MVPFATFIESLLLVLKTISKLLCGANTSEEKLSQAVHFGIAESSKSEKPVLNREFPYL
jgi:hypothetical protein